MVMDAMASLRALRLISMFVVSICGLVKWQAVLRREIGAIKRVHSHHSVGADRKLSHGDADKNLDHVKKVHVFL